MLADDFSQATFKPCPEFFQGIEVRRVWGQKDNLTIKVTCKRRQNRFSMERSVIQNYVAARLSLWQQAISEPPLENLAVCRAAIFEWRQNILATLSRDNVTPRKLFAADFAPNFHAAHGASILSIKAALDAGFVNINPFMRRNIRH
jgi:hypothetical protein